MTTTDTANASQRLERYPDPFDGLTRRPLSPGDATLRAVPGLVV